MNIPPDMVLSTIRVYDNCIITEAVGVDGGFLETFFYSASAQGTPDVVSVYRAAPVNRVSDDPGIEGVPARVGDLCRITVNTLSGEKRLYVETEKVLTAECEEEGG